jgi:hypothetical protein
VLFGTPALPLPALLSPAAPLPAVLLEPALLAVPAWPLAPGLKLCGSGTSFEEQALEQLVMAPRSANRRSGVELRIDRVGVCFVQPLSFCGGEKSCGDTRFWPGVTVGARR